MYKYFAKIERDEDDRQYYVTFPDVPEAITFGDDMDAALDNAQDGLDVALSTLMKMGLALPAAKAKKAKGLHVIHVSAWLAAKLAVYETWREAGISKTELANRMSTTETIVRRMFDPTHHTKLDPLDEAMKAMGKRLAIDVAAA